MRSLHLEIDPSRGTPLKMNKFLFGLKNLKSGMAKPIWPIFMFVQLVNSSGTIFSRFGKNISLYVGCNTDFNRIFNIFQTKLSQSSSLWVTSKPINQIALPPADVPVQAVKWPLLTHPALVESSDYASVHKSALIRKYPAHVLISAAAQLVSKGVKVLLIALQRCTRSSLINNRLLTLTRHQTNQSKCGGRHHPSFASHCYRPPSTTIKIFIQKKKRRKKKSMRLLQRMEAVMLNGRVYMSDSLRWQCLKFT